MFDKLDLMLPEKAFDGPMQMALDEVLLKRVSRPLLRIYQWSAPCVTFGYFQKLQEVHAAYPDIPLVRRWTGGGIVKHGKDLTFSLMIPNGNCCAAMPPVNFYRELHGRLAAALARMTPSTIRLAGEEDRRPGSSCFTAPATDDLLMRGEKILGGAQRRSAGALLYQGSLQESARIAEAVTLQDAVAGSLSDSVTSFPLNLEWELQAVTLSQSRYRSSGWNDRK